MNQPLKNFYKTDGFYIHCFMCEQKAIKLQTHGQARSARKAWLDCEGTEAPLIPCVLWRVLFQSVQDEDLV